MFSNAASNWLHSPTGYICLTFIHCVFSNVSSSGLSGWMQNHTGCTCLLFLRSVFSNIPLDCLPWRMCNHTFYMCLVFLQTSNVYSNAPHKRMQSHIGCICFSSVCVFKFCTCIWNVLKCKVIKILNPKHIWKVKSNHCNRF